MNTRTQRESAKPETPGLLIAGGDREVCRRMAGIFADSGYTVTVTNSAPEAVADVLRGVAQVVLIDNELGDCRVGNLVTLLKQCNPDLSIILVSGDAPVPLLRKLRREGIFYHALQGEDVEDTEEIRQAVRCAFASRPARRAASNPPGAIMRTHNGKERRVP